MPVARIDEAEMTRLFQNLIGNAIRYQPPGRKPVVSVTAALETAGMPDGTGNWVFSIADNGIGIAEQDFGRIFGIFQRLHGQDQYEGTGIGLSICQKIVERHGGRIWLDSVPGEGSIFKFSLPAVEEAPAEG